eukprot:m.133544 g.133544  ORF g.133544 m.133544 type:complete len:96 (+) comp9504_c0_seq3:867-1154(+)
MNGQIRRELFMRGWSRAPALVNFSPQVPRTITHTYVRCMESEMSNVLATSIMTLPVSSAIVFVPPTVQINLALKMLSEVVVCPIIHSFHIASSLV